MIKKYFAKRKAKFLLASRELWEYRILLVRPFWFGLIGAVLWYILHPFFEFSSKEDLDLWIVVLGLLVTLLGTIHGFLAANQVMNIVQQRDKMFQAYKAGDEKEFYRYECIRIQPYIKAGLFIFSVLFWLIFLFCPFPSNLAGILIEWIVIFVLYFIWEIAAEAEDPYHGIKSLNKKEVEAHFAQMRADKKEKKKRKKEKKFARQKQILKEAFAESRHMV